MPDTELGGFVRVHAEMTLSDGGRASYRQDG